MIISEILKASNKGLFDYNTKPFSKENIDYIIITDKIPKVGDYILGGYIDVNNYRNTREVPLWHSTQVFGVEFAHEHQGIKGYYARTRNSIILVTVSEGNAIYREAAEKAFAAK